MYVLFAVCPIAFGCCDLQNVLEPLVAFVAVWGLGAMILSVIIVGSFSYGCSSGVSKFLQLWF